MLSQILELYNLLDRADVTGAPVAALFEARGADSVETRPLVGPKGKSDFIRIIIEGERGARRGGDAPTLGITGRLGGLGARPEVIGFVSDGDGALAALGVALKLCDMKQAGDPLPGDVIISTHICPDSPTIPHDPVPFMGSHVDTAEINALEVELPCDAVLSCDTTKGNRVVCHNGFAISCTVKQGWILRCSEDLLDIYTRTTGRLPVVFPLSQQDITPYGNGVYHLNSILQPAIKTDAPVVGVAITTQMPVAGCASGATHMMDVEGAARFMLEVCKDFTLGRCRFYDLQEFDLLGRLYGDMSRFQTKGEGNPV